MNRETDPIVVDVVIPVYRGLASTRACLESVLAQVQRTQFEVVVIDDASPEPELVAYLEALASSGRIRLLGNEVNLGFVATVNRGMQLHPDRDVVLLNSDTEVANNWLDRLSRCVHARPDIGTATPFSNNATICSYPGFCLDNALPEGTSLAALDVVFSQTNAGQWREIPTAVGFCMYIRRACLDQVGLFDAERFGRGYGEENDFSRRAAESGWKNVLCADTFVFHAGGVSFGAERLALQAVASRELLALHPDYDALIQRFITADPPADLRRAVTLVLESQRRRKMSGDIGVDGQESEDWGGRNADSNKPVQLHVTHDLGGGIAHWLGDYCRADFSRTNLVLKPYSRSADFGEGLALFADIDAVSPLRLWLFSQPIHAAAVEHPEYQAVIREILEVCGVGGIVVSSLIGHALSVLDTGLPTLVVCHDYFPYCPAINIHFRQICTHCDADRLAECQGNNPDFNPFSRFTPTERLQVREEFVKRAASGRLSLVAPSQSVLDNLMRMEPRFRQAGAVVIPHGHGRLFERQTFGGRAGDGRLRILILGMLAPSKGVGLLSQAIDEILTFADIHLLGSGELGALFQGRPGVRVMGAYRLEALPGIVKELAPDVGLLMSICAETYGYTLTELTMLGVPPVATCVGAFQERIRHLQTGYLYEPNAASMIECLRCIDSDRRTLNSVTNRLAELPTRSAAAMVADYHRLLPLPAIARTEPMEFAKDPDRDQVRDIALDAAAKWKEIKSLHLSLGVRDALIAKSTCDLDAARYAIAERDRMVQDLQGQIIALLTSTSWKATVPLRWFGTLLKQARKHLSEGQKRGIEDAGRNKSSELVQVAGQEQAVQAAEEPVSPPLDWRQRIFRDYRASFTDDIRAAMIARIEAMTPQPQISVLVPVYNPPAGMLAAMLDSVLAQIYPNWQLCIVDDASSLVHVTTILQEYAARDDRIQVDRLVSNGGVSHASNRALAMATGDFVVLLDHDDLLEEQALFRVAEAILQDDPDMLYSDEVLVGEDGVTVEHFIFRPAFSPEYLRSHPYIVHLVGFKPGLLSRIGGFDETLRISQDYDLILRASEQAGKITHIPEMLYRWRIHTRSAGHQMIGNVMATSRAILQQHLQRCGEAGEVQDGPSFNYFEVRYPLRPNSKVAIIIPTKNQGELVRTCVGSIRNTIGKVDYELVLVDHASDDPDSLACFEQMRNQLTLLRYQGVFNFAAINNWAVDQLKGEYTHYLFCNNDIEAIQPGWLERMMALGQQPDIGIVGAKLYYPDRHTIQHAGVVVACCGVAENLGRFRDTGQVPLDTGYLGSLVTNREVSAVTAACLLIKRSVFEELNGFDESIAVGYGDVDLCLRAGTLGLRVIYCAHAALIHHESYTRGRHLADPHPEDTNLFLSKWTGLFAAGDPYFSPNLSPHSPNWQVNEDLAVKLDVQRRQFVIGHGVNRDCRARISP